MLMAAALIALSAAIMTSVTTPPGVATFLHDHHITRYRLALADLNGDDRPEALVYGVDTARGGEADLCSSGGCNLYVLSLEEGGYRLVSRLTVTRAPICVLPTTTHGWRDLSVLVAGGGIVPGYEAWLRFDGSSYPANPSVPPATRLEGTPGTVAIAHPPLEIIRSAQRVISHLDLTSFRNSTRPRRVPGKKSFADYGFTQVQLTSDGAILYQRDHGWMMRFRILSHGPASMRICLWDRGLPRPKDTLAPSYDAQSALVLSTSDGQWWMADEKRGGFETCSNEPGRS